MEIARIDVGRTTGTCTSRGRIPAGIVGASVQVAFTDPVWDDLIKTVVFRGNKTMIAEFDGTVAVIPHEVVTEPGVALYFGIFGHDPETDLQIPLIEVRLGTTEKATDANADPGTDPTLPIWAQLQKEIEEIKQQGPGPEVEDGEDGGYYTPAVTQLDEDTIQFTFTPSKPDMPDVEPVTVELPSGQGSGGNVEKHNLDPTAHADIRRILAAANLVKSASGEAIVLDDASGMELIGLKVYGKTIQNGTPTPENPVPLQSVGDDGSVDVTICGKNLLNMPARSSTANGIHYHAEGNELSFYGTATGSYGDVFLHKNILCLPAGKYTLSAVGISAISRIEVTRYSTATGTQFELMNLNGSNPKYTYTLLEPCTFQFIFVVTNGTSLGTADSPTTIKIQMECGDSATDFEPYKNAQSMMVSTPNGLSGIPVSSAGNYIDANGQWWVCDEVDFARGVRVQRIGRIDSYVGETVGEIYLSSTGVITDGASVLYPMEQAVEYPLSTEELTAYAAMHTNYPNTVVLNDSDAWVEVTYSPSGKRFDYNAYGLPVVYLEGDIKGMTKNNAVNLTYTYDGRTGTASVKWQGSSSLSYPKKNYTIEFDNAFEAVEGWGTHSKYCLKANYIDFSHARNIVSAKLWGRIVKSRNTVPTHFAALPNGGAVDGFPVCVVINGEYNGLYTFNIPKDAWLFGMGNGEKECMFCANDHKPATVFEGLAVGDGSDFEIEYISDENNTGWAVESLNRLISTVMNSDGTDIDTVLSQYVDINSVIDYTIFTALITGHDNVSKNYIMVTYDGTKWYMSMYDMDSTYGLHWNGHSYYDANKAPTFTSFGNALARLVIKHKKDTLKSRYAELRSGILSETNVTTTFANFITGIPVRLLMKDTDIWPLLPGTATNNLSQIVENYRQRAAILDAEIEALTAP